LRQNQWKAGARDAGKNPSEMPVLVEQYVVVGGADEAQQAAEYWRFGPKAFKGYFNVVDPAAIQQRAEAEVPIEKVTDCWPIGLDPRVHVAKMHELFDSGVSIVNVHAGQMDQQRVIEFYGREVLPKLGLPA
jgi:F420-dependent hydroxymycolic acid dehydrogenase